MKLVKLLAVATVSLGVVGASVVPASASATTVPKKLRGTYYAYQGYNSWDKLKISKHSAYIKIGSDKAFKLTTKAKSKAHRLSYKNFKSMNRFYLNSKIKVLADSPFPAGGMQLASRKIGKKHYKVIRGYQSATKWDFIKGKKVKHIYRTYLN